MTFWFNVCIVARINNFRWLKNAFVIGILTKLNMMSRTNRKASVVSGEMEYPCNINMYLLIDNPFSGALLPCDNEGAVLKSHAISGNLDNPSSSKIGHFRETISLLISSPDLSSEITGRSASWKAFSQYDDCFLVWFLSLDFSAVPAMYVDSGSTSIWQTLHLFRTLSCTSSFVEQGGKTLDKARSNGLDNSMVGFEMTLKRSLSPFFRGSR